MNIHMRRTHLNVEIDMAVPIEGAEDLFIYGDAEVTFDGDRHSEDYEIGNVRAFSVENDARLPPHFDAMIERHLIDNCNDHIRETGRARLYGEYRL